MELKKHYINFSKYFGIGMIATIMTFVLSWIFIDVLGLMALVASTIIGIAVFIMKYFSYRKIRFIKKKFLRFIVVNALFTILYIILSSLLIDIIRMNTLIATAVIVGGIFILRYFAFYWTGLVEE